MFYIFNEDRINADSYTLACSTSLEEIMQKAHYFYSRLTSSEKKQNECYIAGYEGISSREEYDEMMDSCYRDPGFFKPINDESFTD